MPSEPPIVIIVLNWNNATDTLSCLESLTRITYPVYSVLLVDNGSTDNSVEFIRNRFPNINLLKLATNLGYTGGNNYGVQKALEMGASLICFLNNDVVVTPDFLEPLVAALEVEDIGVSTPLIATIDKPEYIWALGAKLDPRKGSVARLFAGESVQEQKRNAPFFVDIAPGSALLVKREVFERIGGLDDRFYLYFEESDWCLRLRKGGYKIVAVPQSHVLHKVSATFGVMSPIVDYYMTRNHLLFISRHWFGLRRLQLLTRAVLRSILAIAVYSVKTEGRQRKLSRNARLLALHDAARGCWGPLDQEGQDALRQQ